MTDQLIHDNEPEFNKFIDEMLTTVGENAEKQGICMECLSDRLVVELVSGMVRSGVAVSAILAMVGEGIEAAESNVERNTDGNSRRMH